MERSITAGHCCETSYSPKTQTSVTVSGFILLHRRVQTAFMTIFEWMFRKMSRCANMTLDRHRGGITLYYLATQSSPEEAEDRWRYGCCSRHHDPHSSPQRLLQPRLKKKKTRQRSDRYRNRKSVFVGSEPVDFRTWTLWKMSLSHRLLLLMMPSLTSANFLSTAKFNSHFLKGDLAPLWTWWRGICLHISTGETEKWSLDV